MMPAVFYYIFAGVFGVIVGSFLNVVVLRDNRRKTIMTGRSECMHCGHPLAWYELIPVLSFVIQLGRCRSCKKPLSWQYPLGELASAGLAVFAMWYGFIERDSLLLAAGIYLTLAAFLVMSETDFRTMEIRPEYALFAAIVAALVQGFTGNLAWIDILYGVLLGAGSILILSYGWKLLTGKMGMGEGDAWIAGAVGALVGYPSVIAALFIAVGIGAVVGVVLAARAKTGLSIEMPFGPYLALGGLLALVWGQVIISWYIL